MADLDAIILASGLSRRMGRNKLLLPFGEGDTVIGSFLHHFPYQIFGRTVLVYGDDLVRRAVESFPLETHYNPYPEQGKSGSIQLGLACCSASGGVMFFVGDQPLLDAETIHALVAAFAERPQYITLPLIDGRYANPVIFPRWCDNELMALRDDQGGKELFRGRPDRIRTVPFPSFAPFLDVDTEAAYQKVCGMAEIMRGQERAGI